MYLFKCRKVIAPSAIVSLIFPVNMARICTITGAWNYHLGNSKLFIMYTMGTLTI